MTSSPGPMPSASRLRWSADVPELTATQCRPSTSEANSSSNAATSVPWDERAGPEDAIDSRPLLVTDHRLGRSGIIASPESGRRGRRRRSPWRGTATSPDRPHQTRTRAAHPADAPSRVPYHESRTLARRGQRPLRHRSSAQAPTVTPAKTTAPAPTAAPSSMRTPRPVQSPAASNEPSGDDRARMAVVGEDHRGADEHAVPEGRGRVEERVVLDLAPGTEHDARVDEHVAARSRTHPRSRRRAPGSGPI